MIFRGTYKTENLEMDYAKIGEGEKNLVMIPGLSFRKVTPSKEVVASRYRLLLKNGYTIWLFDARTDPPERYTNEAAAEDLLEVMDALGISEADFFGASQGGMIAECMAILHPEKVKKLVLASTVAKVNAKAAEIFKRWIGLAKERKQEELIEEFGKHCYSETIWKNYGDIIRTGYDTITEEEYERFIRMAGAAESFDCSERLSEISAETLAVGSEGDRVFSVESMKELRKIPDSEIFLYGPEYGHAVYDEAPDYVERVYRFLVKQKV